MNSMTKKPENFPFSIIITLLFFSIIIFLALVIKNNNIQEKIQIDTTSEVKNENQYDGIYSNSKYGINFDYSPDKFSFKEEIAGGEDNPIYYLTLEDKNDENKSIFISIDLQQTTDPELTDENEVKEINGIKWLIPPITYGCDMGMCGPSFPMFRTIVNYNLYSIAFYNIDPESEIATEFIKSVSFN